MSLSFLDRGQPLLDQRFPLPLDQPFTRRTADQVGIHSTELTRLVRLGLVRPVLERVYVAAQVPDSLDLRVAALRLVVPPGAVVTDRTAGWLLGVEMILAPNDHLEVPKLSVFHTTEGCRLRGDLIASGERTLRPEHVMEIQGIPVTTPLRTACDLGRLLHRDAAFAALDAMLRYGVRTGTFSKEELVEAASGFRYYRWVRQLRALAPLADHRSDSPPESVMRLRWLDCATLPRPEPQRPVRAPAHVVGGLYWIDAGVDELRFGVEYFGDEAHGPEHEENDSDRLDWLIDRQRWTMRVVRRDNVFGPDRDIESTLHTGIAAARAALGNRRIFV